MKKAAIRIEKNNSLYTVCLVFFTLIFSFSHAADYYWVGGSGNWNDLAHWSNVSGGSGSAYASQPSSNDNVFFDGSSGLALGSTITFASGATSTCKDLMFDPVLDLLGIKLVGSNTARFDLNGNMSLATGMVFTGWTGDWYFYQSTTGATNTLFTGGNTFNNKQINFQLPSSGTGGDFIVNGDFKTTYACPIRVNLQTISNKVTINGMSNSISTIDIVKGEVYFMHGFFQHANTTNDYMYGAFTRVYSNGKLFNYGDINACRFFIDGEVYLNAGNTSSGNTIKVVEIRDYTLNSVANVRILDFNNCRVNVLRFFSFGGQSYSNSTNTIINAANSTLTFLPQASQFNYSQHTFNKVIFQEAASLSLATFVIVASGPMLLNTATIDTIIIDRNINFAVQYPSWASHKSNVNITGLFQITPGHDHTFNAANGTRVKYVLQSGAAVDMQGTCDKPITLNRTIHDFSSIGAGIIAVANLVFGPDNATALGGTYSAGSGSRIITGTTLTGWTIAPSTGRTLVWVGGCGNTPISTLPDASTNRDNGIYSGLNFTVIDSMILKSVDVYVSNSHPSGNYNVTYQILNSSNVVIASVARIANHGAVDSLITLPFNKNLGPGNYYIRRALNNTYISFRYNASAVFPIDIVAEDTKCKVGEITSGIPTSANYYTFFNWKTASLTTSASNNLWYDSQNWVDVTALTGGAWTANPSINPGNRGYAPACPPTEIDSVIFPNESFVFCDQLVMYCEGMNWLGKGSLIGSAIQKMEVWGSLTFHSQMNNYFNGTFRFRSNRPYRCKIITKNKEFNKGVLFNSENGLGEWLLMDTLIAIKSIDNEINSTNSFSGSGFIEFRSGHLHTGTVNCVDGNGSTIIASSMSLTGGTLSLYDSDIRIQMKESGATGYLSYFATNNSVLNCGTSHFYFTPKTMFYEFEVALGNHTYYDITFEDPANVYTGYSTYIRNSANTKVRNLVLKDDNYLFSSHSNSVFLPMPTSATPAYYQKIHHQSIYSLDCHLSSASANYPVLADTLILDQGKLIANYDIYVRSLLKLPSNVPHSIKNGRKIQLQPAYSGVSPYLPSCPGGGTLSTTGAKAELNGSCASSFYITGGTFENNSPYPLNVDYAVITDNTVTGSNTPGISTNSILSGVTTGWTGAAAQARKLHWVNSSATVGDTGDFYDGNNWEQLLPFYAAAPQCPPTVIDTVLFDNTSFSAANQVVQLTGTPDVASMYWENIPSGMSPKLSGLATTQMSIRASLHFHDNMVNNQLGPFLFRGIPTTDFPVFTIRGGTNKFLNKIEFLGDTDTTKWKLTDSLVQIYNNTFANTGYMYFKRGHIITNGKTVNVNGYLSTGVLKRHLDMTNSIVKTKFPWQISGTNVGNTTAEYTQTSDGSTVIINPPNTFFNDGSHIYFGGEKYNRVIANINCGNYGDLLSTNLTDSINYLEVNSINSKQYVGLKTVVKHAVFNNNIVLVTDRGVYDTLIFNNNATINTSNKYNNLLHFEPGRSYTLKQSTVQWVQNNAELELNGLSTATPIQFYGSPTGQQAYIRKDSGLVCADYVNIRDMWAIGNGNDAFGTCSPNNYCTHTNPWIPSSCDTIVDLLSSCGPWTINPADHNRGRADFNGGEYADFQGGNTFGWDKRAYPPAPLVSLTNLKDSICRMDSVAIQVSGVGTLPFIITWKENGVYHADTIYSAAELDSYNPTTSEFEIITWYYPMADISITDFAIKTERCLGSDSPVDNGVASITMLPCFLGVELLDFKATLKNTDVLLNWSTASELNNDYFELQYTHDGVNWEVVDKVKGKGTTHTLSNYSYVHYRPFGQSNTLYYRLKQVDFDGTFDYSPIRSVALNNGEGYVVYPNPATNVLYVSGKGAFNYQMLDASGKIVAKGASSGQDEISLFQLNPGVYMLEITDEQGVKEIFKIVKI